MIGIITACKDVDREERSETVDDLRNQYAHLQNCDPYTDMLFAEINDEPVAYARVGWFEEKDPVIRVYYHFFFLIPEWRGRGSEAIARWAESA